MSYSDSPVGDVQFTSPDVGWAVSNSSLHRTPDAGVSWQRISDVGGVRSICVVNDESGFAVGQRFGDPAILATHEVGDSWTTTSQLPDRFLPQDVFFADRMVGWIGGTRDGVAGIARTDDGEESWSLVRLNVSFVCYCVRFFGDSGYAVLSNEAMQHSSGVPEQDIRELAHRKWNELGCPSNKDERLWLEAEAELNSSVVCHSQDGGHSWEILHTFDREFLWWVSAVSSRVAWLGGRKLFSNVSGDWQSFDQPGVGAFTCENRGIIGWPTHGRIARTSDTGKSWSTAGVGVNGVRALSYRDALSVYAATGNLGAGSTIVTPQDGGASWETLANI